MESTPSANGNKLTVDRAVAAVTGLLFGVAYGSASLHTALGAPLLTASALGLGVILAMTFKGKRKTQVTA
jgi:hypothetical protein